MSPARLFVRTPIASAAVFLAPVVVVLATAVPAAAFHHVALPANVCAAPDQAGGNNPTAVTALRAHNDAQSLPLPPVGFENAPVDRALTCAGRDG